MVSSMGTTWLLRVVADDDLVGVPPPARIGPEEILFFLIPLEVQPEKNIKKNEIVPLPRPDL